MRWVQAHGRWLRRLRKDRRISLRQAADEVGMTAAQISRIERGRDARLSTIIRIDWALGDLIDLDPYEPVEEAGDLLTRKRWRREERQEAGLERRWG